MPLQVCGDRNLNVLGKQFEKPLRARLATREILHFVDDLFDETMLRFVLPKSMLLESLLDERGELETLRESVTSLHRMPPFFPE